MGTELEALVNRSDLFRVRFRFRLLCGEGAIVVERLHVYGTGQLAFVVVGSGEGNCQGLALVLASVSEDYFFVADGDGSIVGFTFGIFAGARDLFLVLREGAGFVNGIA